MSSKINKNKGTTKTTAANVTKRSKQIYSCMFEVYGTVQGVYFRKHTQLKAKNLRLYGWCMNTNQGTVKGVIEGSLENITEMRNWLEKEGSPLSKIEKAVFTLNEPLPIHNFKNFSIRR